MTSKSRFLGCGLGNGGEGYGSGGADVGGAGHGDLAFGRFDDGFADGEAEACAAGLAVARGVTAVEALEDVGQRFGVDSLPLIFDLHLDGG